MSPKKALWSRVWYALAAIGFILAAALETIEVEVAILGVSTMTLLAVLDMHQKVFK